MLAGAAFSASINETCPAKNGRLDDSCILNNARTLQDCEAMSADSIFRDSCYKKMIITTTDYDEITTADAHKECVLYQHYAKNRNNFSACEDMQPDYVKDCYIYFVHEKTPTDLDGCNAIPSSYRLDCQKRLLRGMVGTNPQESFCDTQKIEYKEVCLQIVEERKALLGLAAGALGAGLGIAGLFLLAPLCIILVVLIIAIAVIYYFWQKGKKEKKT